MDTLDREKLKAARRGLKLTQEKLAERAGTTCRTIRYIENEGINPLATTLYKICESLNLSVDSVIIRRKGDENDV